MTSAADKNELLLKQIGHVGTAVLGVLLVVTGCASVTIDLPVVLTVALLAFGISAITLAYFSWNGSRMAWSFAMVLDGVLAMFNLFGSTKIARLAGIPLGGAMLPFVLAVVSCIMLALVSKDYDR
ncbi:MAG TPA: hypothetical protein VL463_25665 [Kofleriaceae bacterium]|jgi:hypothetical protein|nr:hypothetical protein [Kofleriaceae bacterium]